MDLKDEFDLAVYESIPFHGHTNTKRNDNKYYDDAYAEPIKKYFKNNGVESYEVNYSKRYKCTSICAFASSGRICYLYFRPKNARFEESLSNDLSNSRPTKMDAVVKDTNYECKCQEIVSKSHTPLSVKYLESNLFKEFNVNNYNVKPVEEKDEETGKPSIKQVLEFDVNELNIKLKGKNNYSNLHFDLKQLICHLIAIANNNQSNSPKILKYVFFTPNKEVVLKYKKVEKLYKELKEEINAILNKDSSISRFAENHNIKIIIDDSSFVEIKDVEDFNYPEAFK